MESTRISPNEVLKDAYYKHISLSNTVKRKTADFIRFLNNIFIPLMKKRDILFDFLFQQVYLEGSYINTHKTYNANECNLNIVLKLPVVDDGYIEFTDNKCDPGFVICILHGAIESIPLQSTCFNESTFIINLKEHLLFDPELEAGYDDKQVLKASLKATRGFILSPSKTKAWMYGIVRKMISDKEFIETFPENGIHSIKLSSIGSIITLQSNLTNGVTLDLDIVPSFTFKCSKIFHLDTVGKEVKNFWKYGEQKKSYLEFGEITRYDDFLIYETGAPKARYAKNRFQWRLDLIDIEKRIVYQNGCAKMIIELLEYLRDYNPEIQRLSCYALRTAALLVIKEHPLLTWKEDQLSMYFLLVLARLREGICKRYLPFYFHPRSNILDNISTPSQVPNNEVFKMKYWLGEVINKLKFTGDMKKCALNWEACFKTSRKKCK